MPRLRPAAGAGASAPKRQGFESFEDPEYRRWMDSGGKGDSHEQSRREGDFGSDAFDILRRRYARGEIDKQQYETMLRDLEQGIINA
ncbi:MAG: SHOCT domain-containing protein [Desulfosarcinaceae bacterium]|jgi:hypothetical protein